jgi:proliferating cell nuclear antigen PCNA
MKLSIVDKSKKDIFISLFQLLKNAASVICINFNDDHIYIQGMDKSHICLFDIKIFSSWFNTYEYFSSDDSCICVCSQFFYNILAMSQDKTSLNIHYEGKVDAIFIDLLCEQETGDYNKYFKLPLTDFEPEVLNIPNVDYDAEFSIGAKKICELCTQLLIFGDIMNVKCNEDKIDIVSKGVGGEMAVNIQIDDLNEFSISEGEIIDISYSLNYIHKMCLSSKLSTDIGFSISKDYPLRIKYDLGEDSVVMFYMAPRIDDDD